jgi:hypothetical protein
MVAALEVIVIHDETLRDPKPKLVSCVHPAEGWFYRINSRPFLRPNVSLTRDPDHPWLDHDSYLHCEILMLDDYLVEESLRRHGGVIGAVSANLKREIRRQTLQARYISADDGARICQALAD